MGGINPVRVAVDDIPASLVEMRPGCVLGRADAVNKPALAQSEPSWNGGVAVAFALPIIADPPLLDVEERHGGDQRTQILCVCF